MLLETYIAWCRERQRVVTAGMDRETASAEEQRLAEFVTRAVVLRRRLDAVVLILWGRRYSTTTQMINCTSVAYMISRNSCELSRRMTAFQDMFHLAGDWLKRLYRRRVREQERGSAYKPVCSQSFGSDHGLRTVYERLGNRRVADALCS